jgi:hypothetical protein
VQKNFVTIVTRLGLKTGGKADTMGSKATRVPDVGRAAELSDFSAEVAHWLNFEIHNSVQLPTNPMIQGQPNAYSICIRSSEPLLWQTVSYCS